MSTIEAEVVGGRNGGSDLRGSGSGSWAMPNLSASYQHFFAAALICAADNVWRKYFD